MPVFAAIADSLVFRAALAALVLSSFGIYKRQNERSTSGDVLMTRFDDAIPFLPMFSVPYLLYFPYLFFVIIYGIMASPHFAHIAASALAVQLSAALIYHIHQTHVPRPHVAGNGIFARLTAYIYRFDKPFCTFPSLHVAYSLLCCYWSAMMFPSLAPAFAALSAMIIASTLFLKQHAVADVVAGVSIIALSLFVIV